ncbi:MAG: LPS assembly lipoprotein LptE [Acidobacteriota bacterium]
MACRLKIAKQKLGPPLPSRRLGGVEAAIGSSEIACRLATRRADGPARLLLGCAALLMLLLQPGCGYRVASANRLAPDISSVAVLPLQNKTSTFAVEQVLTRSLIHALVEKTGYKVLEDASQADAVLKGVISRATVRPVTFGRGSFGSTFLVTLTAQIELKERRSGKVLFKNDRYIFREQYVINADLENFFSELNPAIDRIAGDFASSVVSTMVEGF